MNIPIYILTFLLISNWIRIRLVILGMLKTKQKVNEYKNKEITDFIFDQTGVKIHKLKIADTKAPFAAMNGLFGKSILTLTKGLLNSFSKEEMAYVLLHETGHFYHHHAQIIAFSFLLLIALGILLIAILNLNFIVSIFLGLLFGVISTFVQRACEYQAEKFALERLDNTDGYISATMKFVNHYNKSIKRNSLQKIFDWLFNLAIPHEKRIEIGNKWNDKCFNYPLF